MNLFNKKMAVAVVFDKTTDEGEVTWLYEDCSLVSMPLQGHTTLTGLLSAILHDGTVRFQASRNDGVLVRYLFTAQGQNWAGLI